MNEADTIQDIDKRLTNLENFHKFGLLILLIPIIIYLVNKTFK
jgi:hypothetical protein